MNVSATKPYLIRAIYEWCIDNEFTPYISVNVDSRTHVPTEYIKNGEIVLNIGHSAVEDLVIGNDMINLMARFNGIARKMEIPVDAVKGIFAKEVNEGITFIQEIEKAIAESTRDENEKISSSDSPKPLPPNNSKPQLRIIK
ncbi:stringent starvation protein B [Nitrosomonas cryotolerans]|uniref:Stringent starvation protein B n=1 Tax=Nitrosomonas cryotolerans ATCC 49181 TaxID=1131553 RepID=A0A1N6JKH3_9PROT|nr:ClpXP protease specificity-enhancing factor [Nitrosomonas cryotolerans]SFQ00033.1 stringent starvation protein B [Nitrosomonas cryotolerans]SIO44904.1 stringent starvation protein B [Nitrosomonas cryotolerans ATCC 49181]